MRWQPPGPAPSQVSPCTWTKCPAWHIAIHNHISSDHFLHKIPSNSPVCAELNPYSLVKILYHSVSKYLSRSGSCSTCRPTHCWGCSKLFSSSERAFISSCHSWICAEMSIMGGFLFPPCTVAIFIWPKLSSGSIKSHHLYKFFHKSLFLYQNEFLP